MVQTYLPDKTYTLEENGRTDTLLPDFTSITKVPAPGGKFTVTTTFPDRTKTVKDPEGKETTYDSNGNWQKIDFPKKTDGSFNRYTPDGKTVNVKPDGTQTPVN